MIVYHIDKMRNLVPGQIINQSNTWSNKDKNREHRIQTLNRLYSGNLTFFGVQSLDDFQGKANGIEMTELLLDYVRCLCHPELPSRFTVLFASRTVELAMKWFSPLSLLDCTPQVLALETNDEVFAANALFRDEVSNRVSALCEEFLFHQTHESYESRKSIPPAAFSSLCSTCIVQCLDSALSYWDSAVPVWKNNESPLYEREELLIIPPARVLHQIRRILGFDLE